MLFFFFLRSSTSDLPTPHLREKLPRCELLDGAKGWPVKPLAVRSTASLVTSGWTHVWCTNPTISGCLPQFSPSGIFVTVNMFDWGSNIFYCRLKKQRFEIPPAGIKACWRVAATPDGALSLWADCSSAPLNSDVDQTRDFWFTWSPGL